MGVGAAVGAGLGVGATVGICGGINVDIGSRIMKVILVCVKVISSDQDLVS